MFGIFIEQFKSKTRNPFLFRNEDGYWVIFTPFRKENGKWGRKCQSTRPKKEKEAQRIFYEFINGNYKNLEYFYKEWEKENKGIMYR
ncbi:MAG TPA: hypothetical protein VHP32_01675 [Ignavibacteria bacterium]|nr:hypothetical protein [Ignavibacteria bacterium]